MNVRITASKPLKEQAPILDIAKKGAKTNFELHSEVHPVVILFGRRDLKTGELFDERYVIFLEPDSFTIAKDKDDFAWIVKDIAQKSNASELALVSEVWLTSIDRKTGVQKKIEAVTITTESLYDEPEMWIAEIERKGSSAKLKDFVKQEGFNVSTGRFVGLLLTRGFVS